MLSPNGCNNMTFVVFRVLYLFSHLKLSFEKVVDMVAWTKVA